MEFSEIFSAKFLNNPIFADLNQELKNFDIDVVLNENMSLVCGDFYGIQSFIFDGLSPKKAPKVIRAKSAFVQIFTLIIAKYVAKFGGMILSANAGKFEVLIPENIAKKKPNRANSKPNR